MHHNPKDDPFLSTIGERAWAIIDDLEDFIATTVLPLEKKEGITRDHVNLPVLRQVWKASRERGFFKLMLPKEHGGPGLSTVELCAIKEAVTYTGAAMAQHVLGEWNGPPRVGYMLGKVTPHQQQTFLEPVVNGDKGICFAITEEGAGSDVASMTTSAELQGDHYVLNGAKRFISGAPYADLAIVVAVTDPAAGARGISAFFVDMHALGASVVDDYETLLGGHGTADLRFDNVKVPIANLIGAEGEGLKLGLSRITFNRLLHCPSATGLARLALRMTVDRAQARKQFGVSIGSFQSIQHSLASMATELYGVRAMMYATAAQHDAGRDIRTGACMCKLTASEVGWRIADGTLQIHGGAGTVRGHFIEWLYRSSRVFRIANGSSEIQRNAIARELLNS